MSSSDSNVDRKTFGPLVKLLVLVVVISAFVLVAFGTGISVGMRLRAGTSETSEALQKAFAPALSLTRQSVTTGPSTGTPTPTEVVTTTSVSQTPAVTSTEGANILDLDLFGEAWGLLQKQFYGNLPAGKEITYDAIRGVIDRLGDPYTAFVDPQQAALLNADMEGHFEGIGARVDLAEGGGVELKYLFSQQPAEKAGLQVGDVIVAVDNKDVTKLGLTEAITMIRGPQGSKVVLTIRRDDQKPFDVPVIRDRIEIPVVESKTLADGHVAYIALSEFSSVAPDRVSDAVAEALANKPSGLILDLRGNPGGLLDAAVRIGSYFVPEGNILIERTKEGEGHVYERQGRYLLGKTPLVVLVDAGSASASEIVAGAIQDAGTGVLIGEKTYGKGSVQLPNTLSDGSQLRVTTARWFTPKNRAIHGLGLEPDVVVPVTKEDVAAERDPQLERAVDYLLKGK